MVICGLKFPENQMAIVNETSLLLERIGKNEQQSYSKIQNTLSTALLDPLPVGLGDFTQ